jgi:HAD superfamily hydrolase (TIGR01459 family)
MSNPILIDSLEEVWESFDVAVLDQWGVLHNGSICYASASEAMRMLHARGKEIIVLSNSGKRADLNLKRIEKMGLPVETISRVVTSGEALWQDVNESRIRVAGKIPRRFYPICGHPDDPKVWAFGSNVEIADEIDPSCDAILLMGLSDDTGETEYDATFQQALKFELPLICSNPDKTSPRADRFVMSPGALADRYEEMGGEVIWYGKPHAPVFQAVIRYRPELAPNRFLMVGDSLEHDIAGGQKVGFKTALVRGGIHTSDFPNSAGNDQIYATLRSLAEQHSIQPPDFSLKILA